MNRKGGNWLSGVAMIFLGMTFAIAAMGKLTQGSKAFDLYAFPSFIPQIVSETFYSVLPYIEITIGILLIAGIAIKLMASISGLLIIGFITSNIILISRGVSECANCFGVAGTFTPGAALVLDGIMAILAAIVLKANWNNTLWGREVCLTIAHKEA